MLARTQSLRRAGQPVWRGVAMRKHVLGAVLVGLVATLAIAASSASALVKPRVFTLLEVEGPEAPSLSVDFSGDRPPRAGDRFQTTNWLYRWTGRKGIRVGHDRVLFSFMTGFGPNFSHKAVVLFQAQVYLPDGTVFVEGYGGLPPDGPVRLKLPVVGATGVYANARGYVKVRGARRTLLEFRLTP
jgi:hypothetical protein